MPNQEEHVKEIAKFLTTNKWKISTVESCTSGCLPAVFTSVSGASNWFEGGFVTYSDRSKEEMVGVSTETLRTLGAVSAEIAQQMAQGCQKRLKTDFAVSTTGYLGPGRDDFDSEDPVGCVYMGISANDETLKVYRRVFQGERNEIREKVVDWVLENLVELFSDMENALS